MLRLRKDFQNVSAHRDALRKTLRLAVYDATTTTMAIWRLIQNGGPPLLLRNEGGSRNNWLGLNLIATRSNSAANGALITWQAGGVTYRRLKTTGGSYLASHDPREILAAGRSKIDSVEVRWPSGRTDKLASLPQNAYLGG